MKPSNALLREVALNVLFMVHELHKIGYQRLRIQPGVSPSGCHWRCAITPVTNILTSHGAMALDAGECVNYNTGMYDNYFGWQDAKQDSAYQLSVKFKQRFPKITHASFGTDWSYAGWYVQMLGFAERGCLPVAYADWCGKEPGYLARDTQGELPFPPPGKAGPV